MENSSGLYLEKEVGIDSFAHLSFQEYLAAEHVRDKALVDALCERVGDTWWHEVIRLYAAQADATPLLDACMAPERPPLEALVLALQCLEEALEVHADTRKKFEGMLISAVEDSDSDRRRVAFESMLTVRLAKLSGQNLAQAIDDSLITNAEFQMFIEEQQQNAMTMVPDHWTVPQFESGMGAKPVYGCRSSDAVAFCKWLSSRGASDSVAYRLPTCAEAEQAMGAERLGNARFWKIHPEGGYECTNGHEPPIDYQHLLTQRLERDFVLVRQFSQRKLPENIRVVGLDRLKDQLSFDQGSRDQCCSAMRMVSRYGLDVAAVLDATLARYSPGRIKKELEELLAKETKARQKRQAEYEREVRRQLSITGKIKGSIGLGRAMGPNDATRDAERDKKGRAHQALLVELSNCLSLGLDAVAKRDYSGAFQLCCSIDRSLKRVLEPNIADCETIYVGKENLREVLRSFLRLGYLTLSRGLARYEPTDALVWIVVATLVVVDARVAGQIEPFEGILVVRERNESRTSDQ